MREGRGRGREVMQREERDGREGVRKSGWGMR